MTFFPGGVIRYSADTVPLWRPCYLASGESYDSVREIIVPPQ